MVPSASACLPSCRSSQRCQEGSRRVVSHMRPKCYLPCRQKSRDEGGTGLHVYACVYTYMHTYLQLCVNTLMCAGIMCVSIHIMSAHACVSACMRMNVYVLLCSWLRVSVYICGCMCVHHLHVSLYRYMQMCVCAPVYVSVHM